MGDILSNRTDDRQIAAAATVVVALHVPDHLVAEATDILEDEAIEVDKSRESD